MFDLERVVAAAERDAAREFPRRFAVHAHDTHVGRDETRAKTAARAFWIEMPDPLETVVQGRDAKGQERFEVALGRSGEDEGGRHTRQPATTSAQ